MYSLVFPVESDGFLVMLNLRWDFEWRIHSRYGCVWWELHSHSHYERRRDQLGYVQCHSKANTQSQSYIRHDGNGGLRFWVELRRHVVHFVGFGALLFVLLFNFRREADRRVHGRSDRICWELHGYGNNE